MKEKDELTVEERRQLVELFAENVWLFIGNTERVLGDDRMSHALVPVSNVVFRSWGIAPWRICVKLGVYLKWWRDYPRDSHDAEGRPLWRVSGIPFNNLPKSASMSKDGKSVEDCRLNGSVKNIWMSLKTVADGFNQEATVDNPYSLREVVEILVREEALRNPYIATLQNRLNNAKQEVEALNSKMLRITEELAGSRRAQIELLVKLDRNAVADFLTEYDSQLKDYRRYLARYYNERKSLKTQRRQGDISGEEYTRCVISMRERRKSMKDDMKLFEQNFLDRMNGERGLSITIGEVRKAWNHLN